MSFRRSYTGVLERDKVNANRFHSVKFDRGDFDDDQVTLEEAKAQCVVTFDDDDDFITSLIEQAIAAVEKHCSVSIQQKTVTILADIFCETELPYGPLLEFTSLELKTGPGAYTSKTLNTDFEIDGDAGDYARLLPRIGGRMRLTYDAGFEAGELPEDLKKAILSEVAYRYENRGDSTTQRFETNPGVCEASRALAQPYIRMQWG